MSNETDDEDDYLALSGLQHYLFCPRQWALIHLEQQWAENRWTAEGQLLHQRADESALEVRGTVWTVRALRLVSASLRIRGVADVVEFHRLAPGEAGYDEGVGGELLPLAFQKEGAAARWRVFPVEYKRGKAKKNDCDRVQLCAQALCLEEMLGASISAGALFYGTQRRRVEVPLDEALRTRTRGCAVAMRAQFDVGKTPPAVYEKHCAQCSLREVCLPQRTVDKVGARAYIARALAKVGAEEQE